MQLAGHQLSEVWFYRAEYTPLVPLGSEGYGQYTELWSRLRACVQRLQEQ